MHKILQGKSVSNHTLLLCTYQKTQLYFSTVHRCSSNIHWLQPSNIIWSFPAPSSIQLKRPPLSVRSLSVALNFSFDRFECPSWEIKIWVFPWRQCECTQNGKCKGRSLQFDTQYLTMLDTSARLRVDVWHHFSNLTSSSGTLWNYALRSSENFVTATQRHTNNVADKQELQVSNVQKHMN